MTPRERAAAVIAACCGDCALAAEQLAAGNTMTQDDVTALRLRAAQAEAEVAQLRALLDEVNEERNALRAANAKAREALEWLQQEVENARAWKRPGGMKCGMPDLGQCPPSTLNFLERLGRDAREALAALGQEPHANCPDNPCPGHHPYCEDPRWRDAEPEAKPHAPAKWTAKSPPPRYDAVWAAGVGWLNGEGEPLCPAGHTLPSQGAPCALCERLARDAAEKPDAEAFATADKHKACCPQYWMTGPNCTCADAIARAMAEEREHVLTELYFELKGALPAGAVQKTLQEVIDRALGDKP